MLERAPACIEHGGRSIARFSRKAVRSRRSLHSAFWSHGASEINLPSWWIALLQQPPPERTKNRQSIVDTAKSCLTAGLTDGCFLDFLYPAKTLSLIHKLAVRDPAHIRTRQHASRTYTSTAIGESLALDSDADHASQLVGDMLRMDDQDEKLRRLVRRQKRYDDECQKLVLGKDETAYLLEDKPDESVQQLAEHLHTAGHELAEEYAEKILAYLHKIADSAYWQPQHYAMAIKAHMLLDDKDKAMASYTQALQNFQDHIATPTIIRIALERKNWQLGVEAWDAYKNTVQAEEFFWSGIQDMDSQKLVQNAMQLCRVVRQSEHGADTFLRQFAISLVENIYSMRHVKDFNIPAYDHYKLFMELRDLTRLSQRQYSLAIEQCLSLRFPKGDANLRKFGENAIRFYMTMRQRKDLILDRELLENLFKRACNIHNIDTQLIFKDLKDRFGLPSQRLYIFMLKEHEHRNDARAVYALLREIEESYKDPMSSKLALRILRMHAQRKELPEAIRLFSSLRDRTGELPQLAHYNVILTAHTHVQDIDGANKWLREMQSRGIQPDLHTYFPLLKHHARRGDIIAVERLVEDIQKQGLPAHVSIIESLIQAHIENEDLDEAQELLFESEDMELEGDRVYMWNLVMTAFAMRRSLEDLDNLRRKMRDANIAVNEMTLAARLQALCIRSNPFNAFRIVRDAKTNTDLRPGAFHYSIVMGGFARTQQYERVFLVYRWMIKHGIMPDFGARVLLVKSAAMIDQKEKRGSVGMRDQAILQRAEEVLAQLLETSEPDQMMNTRSSRGMIKGVPFDSSTEIFSSNFFDYLIFLYGNAKMFEKLEELYSRYVAYATKPMGRDIDRTMPSPTRMLVALMVYHRNASNHQEVERLWNFAVEKSQPLIIREGASPEDENWVLPSRKYILAAPLIQYMCSLADQGRTKEYGQLFQYLAVMGYGIDSKAWNLYVQQTAMNGEHVQAFRVAEAQLMQDWTGWSTDSHPQNVMKRLRKKYPSKLERNKRFPNYKTLVVLAKVYMNVKSKGFFKGDKDATDPLVEELWQVAPRTVEAVVTMPPLDEGIQRAYLGSYGREA
ncbi:MAG: hypothetical protein MMC23_009712 [Stictis urceolatum]|nr:hypothetical protein [Stictis urceolata]